MLVKGTAFTISFYCYQRATGEGATGKAATLTSYISKDGGAPAATTNSPAEVDATNQPGIYSLSLTALETNADNIVITTQSSQSGVEAQPIFITTEPAIPTASDVAAAVNVSGELTNYGAAKTSDVPTASDVAAAVNVSGELTNYGAAKTSDVPTASDVAAAVLTTNVTIAQSGAPADSLLGLVLANFYSSIDTDGTWTIYQTDGETQFTQKKVITSNNADPVTGITKKS